MATNKIKCYKGQRYWVVKMPKNTVGDVAFTAYFSNFTRAKFYMAYWIDKVSNE